MSLLTRPKPASVMVGRAGELAALEALLGEAMAGRGATALVGGDAGIGKTRLCRELKQAAQRAQFRVIEGRSSSAESQIPFGPFRDALHYPLLTATTEEQLELASSGFDRLFNMLQRLANLGPTLFVLEDIHWADSTSLDLLHYIARRIETLPLVVVATYRTDEVEPAHAVQRFAAALTRERIVLRVQLEPLRPPEIEQMLAALMGAPPAADFVAAVADRTQGNPLFIEELITALAQAHPDRWPAIGADDLRAFPAPRTLHEMVWERLGPLLDDQLYEVVTVAAVIGRELHFDLLAAALGWPEDRLLRAIERLVELRVLDDSSDRPGEVLWFRHSLVQEVIYASAIGRRRRMWHRRVAAVIEQLAKPGHIPHTLLVYHYKEGGEPEKARVHMLLAGDEAVRLCAWKDAEAMYEAALEEVEQAGGQANAEADILERMADVAWWQNRLSALEQYLGEALTLRRSLGDSARAAMLLRRLANLHAYQRGEVERAASTLREGLQYVHSGSAEHVYLLNDLGRVLVMQGDYDSAATLFEESLASSSRLGDCAEEALSLVMLGSLAVHSAQVTTGIARLELARALLEEEPLPPERAAEVLRAGVRALEAAHEHEHAAHWVDAGLAYAHQHGALADAAIFRAYQAAVLLCTGNWSAALQLAQDAVPELRNTGRAELREALRILGDVQRMRGELTAARAAYDEAMSLGDSSAAVGRALLFAAEQRWNDAVTEIEAAQARQTAADRLLTLHVLMILIEAHVGAGALDAARSYLATFERTLEGANFRAGRVFLLEAQALTAQDADNAAAFLESALAGWRELALPYEAARVQTRLAELLIQTDARRDEGLELAADALRIFERLGAGLDISRANKVLRQAGVRVNRPRKPTAELPEPLGRLTQRELEVLAELARGRTNKQIAKTLSMSPKTVGNHVSAILAKLGCATRTEASRFAISGQIGES